MRIMVVQHDDDKPLGRIAEALLRERATLDVHVATADLPDPADYDGLIVLPGLADPDDDDPALDRARAALESAVARSMPVLGICLGGELLAQVLGGSAYACTPELGYLDVERTEAARTDPLFGKAPARFSVFHAHRYAFEPPAGSTVLLANQVCAQAFRLGESWATQCHPEATVEWVDGLARGIRGEPDRVDPRTARFFRSHDVDPDALVADARAAAATAERLAGGIGAGFAARCRAGVER
jgi:GMP synthase-like glutamine amidotransferase